MRSLNILSGLIFLLVFPILSNATNYVVTSTADAGPGSLREAVANSVHLDTVLFDSMIDGDTIRLDSQIYTTQAILILGNGVDKTIISGQKKDRLFQFQYMGGPLVPIIISNIRMMDGNGIFTGGAIINQHFLELHNCIIQGCESGSGGAINNQGGLDATIPSSVEIRAITRLAFSIMVRLFASI